MPVLAWIGAAAWAVLGVNTIKLFFGKEKPAGKHTTR